MKRSLSHWILVAGLLVWVGVELIQWLTATPLGHDESQYALAALDFLRGEPPRWFYVSPGMNAIAVPGVLLGAAEVGLRTVPFIVGLAFIGAAWRVARAALSPATAAWTVAVLAGSRSLIQRSTELLSDIPASACLLAAMWLIMNELGRAAGVRWRLVLVAPLFAAAFYVRYASVIPIAVIVVATIAVWWRAVWARWQVIAVAAATFVLLVTPHLVMSVEQTGSALGLLLDSDSVVGGSHGDALVTYLTQRDPFKYYGLLAPPLMVLGAISIVRVRRETRARFVWCVGVGTFLGMGLLTHGQPRYVFIATTLLVMLGVHALLAVAEARSERAQAVIAALALCAVVVAWTSVTRKAIHYPSTMRARLAPTLRASEAIRRDASGQRCHVVARRTTQTEWYSGCTAIHVVPVPLPPGERVYVVRERGGPDLLDGAALGSKTHDVLADPDVRVVRLE